MQTTTRESFRQAHRAARVHQQWGRCDWYRGVGSPAWDVAQVTLWAAVRRDPLVTPDWAASDEWSLRRKLRRARKNRANRGSPQLPG
jgi:hypothetical protein